VLGTPRAFQEPVPVFTGRGAEYVMDSPLRPVSQVVEEVPYPLGAGVDVDGFGDGTGHKKEECSLLLAAGKVKNERKLFMRERWPSRLLPKERGAPRT
jgi:hypothetical protein